MGTIVAGGFQVLTEADDCVSRLQQAGVDIEWICTFRVNPAGEHQGLKAGGDHATSPGARHAHSGAAAGAAIGAVAGLAAGVAAMPLLGPAGVAAGAGAGAYTGSLVGSLKEIDSEPAPDHSEVRPAENMVAVNLDACGCSEETLLRVFEECGALVVERAQGTWNEGCWSDFDPTSRPNVIGGLEFARRADIDPRAGNRPAM